MSIQLAYGPAIPLRTRRLAMDQAPPAPSIEESNAAIIGEVVAMLRDLPEAVLKELVAKLHLLPSRLGKSVAQDDPPPSGRIPTPPPQRNPQTPVNEGIRAEEVNDPNAEQDLVKMYGLEAVLAEDAAAMFPDIGRLLWTDHGSRRAEIGAVEMSASEAAMFPDIGRIRRV